MTNKKPFKKYIFRLVEDKFVNVLGDSNTLADVLENLNIIIDDKTQFARIIDYTNRRYILYRSEALKVTIDIWEISTK